ncbi:AMP-binding enzyme domain-containing protein [Hirsutella rhossiliensis]|uniref:AMP-binding enzyme domain-containing protein n=1 Tax=Hirsutella rhossiliensis TaxID=111463 RepID=A0A9P8SJV6_9HYPO|nr:AMP-binding enzyme domain-containing protein [Hirsutella rhossiliensis]KAH0964579.1 AMP-binding enzyme domain-containing protein [Hirsutella rhossiliensis]
MNCDAVTQQGVLHIGSGAGAVTWIVNPEDHNELTPLGCIGELLIEGPIVGLGYLDDPETTAKAFVDDPVWLLRGSRGQAGRHGRVYKTGDLARYTEEGTIVFIGRKDSQVKIRGQRVELQEIEHVLRSHEHVDGAATVLQSHQSEPPRLVSFITIKQRLSGCHIEPEPDREAQRIKMWETQFDTEVYSSFDKLLPHNVGRDFIGWTSMLDGTQISTEHMNEWLDDTIETILDRSRPAHILEIGTGSGMILFNLTDGLQSYVGLEPSANAVDFVRKTAQLMPWLADKVKIFQATAMDLHLLDTPVAPNLVILNSVVQYFPTQGYLLKTVQSLLQLESVTTIFFGDVRSYCLHREFLAARALYTMGSGAQKDMLQRMVDDMEAAESELLIDPAFFTALQDRFPNRIAHVEILPKRMRASNELSCYRYAAVIYLKASSCTQQQLEIHDIARDEWVDFSARGLDTGPDSTLNVVA